MFERGGSKWFSLLAVFALTMAVLFLLRPDPRLTGLLGMGIIGVRIFAVRRRKRLERTLANIPGDDERSVRFDGSPAQAQAAIAIGKAQGWVAEVLPEDASGMQSVRFVHRDGASSARGLVEAFFQAGLLLRKVEA